MRNFLKGLVVAIFVLLCGAPAVAAVIDVPFQAHMVADGEYYAAPVIVDPNTGIAKVSYHWETDEFVIDMDATLDPDPSIAYGMSFLDLGAPSTFSVSFSTPIVPTGPLSVVDGSIAASITDFTGDGASITPNPANGDPDGDTVIEAQFNSVGTGAPTTNMGVDVGGAAIYPAGSAGALHLYGPYVAGPTAGPAGVWTSLHTTLSFTFSGGGDVASFTGFARIETVPEPSGIILAAVAGVVFVGRRALRRRHA